MMQLCQQTLFLVSFSIATFSPLQFAAAVQERSLDAFSPEKASSAAACQTLLDTVAGECKLDCGVMENGEDIIIDLSPLANDYDFQHFYGNDGLEYSYSPCAPLQLSGTCTKQEDAAVCANSGPTHPETWTNLGRLSTSLSTYSWQNKSDGESFFIKINYTNGQDNKLSTVTLQCSLEDTAGRMTKEDAKVFPETHFYFVGFSKYACPKLVPSKQPRHHSTPSPGSIILLSVFAISAVYIVGGVFFNKIKNDKLSFPNAEFWSSLPGLVKEGALFLLSPCINQRNGYDRLP